MRVKLPRLPGIYRYKGQRSLLGLQEGRRMKQEGDLFAKLGLPSLPGVTRVYLVLVVLFAALVLLSSVPALTVPIGPVASDGLKTVLAALLGALSQAGANRSFR